jgi:ribonuclease P protein component
MLQQDGPSPTPFGLSKAERLTRNRDFQEAFARGVRLADHRIAIYVRATDLPYSRLGIRVSRKCGNAARRNRIKRRLREAYRTHKHLLGTGLDIVVVGRPLEPVPAVMEFAESLIQLMQRRTRRTNTT